jgi:hypothetical protein
LEIEEQIRTNIQLTSSHYQKPIFRKYTNALSQLSSSTLALFTFCPFAALGILSTVAGFTDAFSVPSMSMSTMAMRTSAYQSENDDAILEYNKRAETRHTTKFESGTQNFGQKSPTKRNDTKDVKRWRTDDFTSYSVETGNGGPSVLKLKDGHVILESKDAVLTKTHVISLSGLPETPHSFLVKRKHCTRIL